MNVDSVKDFLLALNTCWQSGDLQGLAHFYHPDVVLLPPDLGEPIHGRDQVVDSYREFQDAATLEDFQIVGLDVFEFPAPTDSPAVSSGTNNTWMAHLTFTVSYTLAGDQYIESGLEIYTVADVDGALKILWRHQSVLDSRLAEKA